MKKSLLFSAVACFAFAANAQTESAFLDVEALGIGEEKVAVTGGTVLASSASVTMKAAYDCEYKKVDMNGENDPFKAITIDGVAYENLATGIQGQSNPTNTKNALTQQPKDKAIFQFDVTADGYLYVFSKLSANKQYYAFEGKYSDDTPSTSISYTIVGGNQLDGVVYSGTMPADKDGYADYSGYSAAQTIGCPFLCEMVGLRGTDDANYGTNTFSDAQKATLLGVAAFPVYKDGGTYYFNAIGSKVTCDGFVFIPGATSVATVNVIAGATSIANVAASAKDMVVYNLLGQRVAANTKGLVIINGKKVIRK